MNTENNLIIEFRDLEDVKNTQVDILRLMQSALHTELTDGIKDGIRALDLVIDLCEMSFDVTNTELHKLKDMRRSA